MEPSVGSMPVSASDHSVARSAGVVSAAVLLSRLTGLVREMVIARLFGDGPINDAFILGFRIPNLTRDLFAEGALSSAFIPTFTRYLTTKGNREASELASLVATAIVLIVGGLCLLGMIFSPALVGLLAPGFEQVPGKFPLAVKLTRIMFPFLLLVALAAQAMGMLNALHQFGIPALSSAFFNLGSLLSGLALGYWAAPWLGLEPIVGMALGVVIGGALQLFVQVPSLLRAGFLPRLKVNWSDPGLRQIMGMMVPAILGNAAVQVNVMVNSNFASSITNQAGQVIDGPMSWLGYAFRFMQLPLGLFGVAIGSATLPAISRLAALNDMDGFRRTLSRSLGMVFLLTIPASVGLAVLGEPIIGAIYQRGAFQASATVQTARALTCYVVGLAAYSALKVVAPSLYALHDARTPMMTSLASILINFAVSYTMVRHSTLGHAGLALSTSSVALFQFAVLLAIVSRRVGGIQGRELLRSVLRIGLASAAMGGVCFLSSHWMRTSMGASTLARLADLAVSIPLGLAVLYGACRILKVRELQDVEAAFVQPLAKRLGVGRVKLL